MKQTTSLKLDHNDELMTAHEVAARLRVTLGAVASYEKLTDNPLPVHRLGSGPRAPKRYVRGEVEAWIRSRWSDRAAGQAS
jgi:predicted DNA-binding transcriptional regulator AlpA